MSEKLGKKVNVQFSALVSGKEKAHKHKQFFPVTARVEGGGSPDRVARGLPTGGQGSKVYVLCAEHKEHKHFQPGTRPGRFGYPAGRIGDRGDREIVFVPNVYVPFSAPIVSIIRHKIFPFLTMSAVGVDFHCRCRYLVLLRRISCRHPRAIRAEIECEKLLEY